MKGETRTRLMLGAGVAFGLFVAASFAFEVEAGRAMGRTFGANLLEMLEILPCAFVLVALFEVWVSRETVERHLGTGSGLRGYLWATALGGMTVGGLFVAFPVAYSLFKKGASLPVTFAYVGLAGVCRIPMTLFEVSFMGPTYTAVRLGLSIPLVMLVGWVMGNYLQRKGYEVRE